MAEEFVLVQAQWGDSVVGFGTGNYLFVATGQLMESANVALVVPVVIGDLDSLGALSPAGGTPNSGVRLLASDSFTDGQLLWDIKIQVSPGVDIVVNQVAVDFAEGATQSLFTILTAAGWSQPPGLG